MLRKINKILICLLAFGLVGCIDVITSSSSSLESSLETSSIIDLETIKADFLDELPEVLNQDFVVPSLSEYQNLVITYESNNEEILNDEGVFSKPIDSSSITISFRIERGSEFIEFDVNYTINGYTPLERVTAAKDEVELPSSVVGNIDLISEVTKYDVNVSWDSKNDAIITDEGIFTKPVDDQEVTLTATFTYQQEVLTHDYKVNVVGMSDLEKVNAVASELTLDTVTTKVDFDLPTSGNYNSVITWESKNTTFLDVENNKADVTRPHENFEDEIVELEATITINSDSVKKAFFVTVEAYQVIDVVFTAPAKTTYFVNDQEISLDGGSLFITLDDQTTKTIDMSMDMVETFDSSTNGEHDIHLSYKGFTFTYKARFINHVTNQDLNVNDSAIETFDDEYNPVLGFDFAQVPNCSIINSDLAIDGNSLYYESAGSYKTLFINQGITYTSGATYRVSFDFKLLSIVDTIYFQFTSSAGNQFTQIGGTPSDAVRHFEYIITLGDATDYLIQIFPGGGSGVTSLVIDNLELKRIIPENNVTVDGAIEEGEYVLETFGDSANRIFTLDLAPTPNSVVTSDESKSIEGTSLFFSSNGNFSGIYIKNSGLFTPYGQYKVSFDYKLISINNTIYIQFTSSSGNIFTEINGITPSEELRHFEYTYTLSSGVDYMIQVFPGAGEGLTEMIIDNLRIERLVIDNSVTETNHKVVGEINEGDYVLETFGDPDNAIFGLDKANSVEFSVINDGIEGKSLYFVSNGVYAGAFLNNPSFTYTINAKYLVEFDYKVISMVDTIYFQFTSGDGSKNVFAQFGSLDSLDTVQKFSQVMTLKEAFDYVINIFPGAGNGEVKVIIDNLTITRLNTNIYATTPLFVGEKVKETFDGERSVFGVDTAPTPNSKIISDANSIEMRSLLLDSPGSYNGLYLTNNTIFSTNTTYRISFDYKVISIDGALYLKIYSDVVVDPLVNITADGEVHTYSYEFVVGNSGSAVLHLFPNQACQIYFDNITIERIG